MIKKAIIFKKTQLKDGSYVYPNHEVSFIAPGKAFKKGEFRKPKKGEYFLSGAQPGAYRAPNDLSINYYIAIPVKVVEETFIKEILCTYK